MFVYYWIFPVIGCKDLEQRKTNTLMVFGIRKAFPGSPAVHDHNKPVFIISATEVKACAFRYVTPHGYCNGTFTLFKCFDQSLVAQVVLPSKQLYIHTTLHSITSQKAAVLVLTTTRTPNPIQVVIVPPVCS
jgi:hypothetical protein